MVLEADFNVDRVLNLFMVNKVVVYVLLFKVFF